jgi:predicted Rossmann-fold nucleotide-binding protein
VEEGVISAEDLELIEYVETADECWASIKHYYQLS